MIKEMCKYGLPKPLTGCTASCTSLCSALVCSAKMSSCGACDAQQRGFVCTALHCSALPCTALHCTALHCTALHITDGIPTPLISQSFHTTSLIIPVQNQTPF